METSNSYTGNVHFSKPFHKRGYVAAEAASTFFAGGRGFSYWLFKQQRAGTELLHGHLVSSWGEKSAACENVRDVSRVIKELNGFILSTKPKKAEVAVLYSDDARAYFECETIEGYDYQKQIHLFYEAIEKSGVYRDVVYGSSDFSGYKVIFVPYLPYVSPAVEKKIEDAVNNGCTVVVGPFTGTRTVEHTIHTDCALSNLEKFIGCHVTDVISFNGQDATFETDGKSVALKSTSIAVSMDGNCRGVIKGGYCDGESVVYEAKKGKGKIVLLGTVLEGDDLADFVAGYINEKADENCRSVTDVAYYERIDKNGGEYACYSNMSGEIKTVTANGKDYFSGEEIKGKLELKPYGYAVIKRG